MKAKELASDVKDRVSDSISVLKKKMRKAYIGPIEEAEEHAIDNNYIVRGYRINHTTCKSLCKSLFKCHNESVNIWSHIGGVIVFIILMIIISIEVLPNQFWYAYELSKDFTDLQAKYGSAMTTSSESLANPQIFADNKIEDLVELIEGIQTSPMNTKGDRNDFEDDITRVLHHIEGVSHFTINQFYTFSYLNYDSEISESATIQTYDSLIDEWYSIFTGYNAVLLDQLALTSTKISEAKANNGKVELSKYVNHRVSKPLYQNF